jgi:hypothetical protein
MLKPLPQKSIWLTLLIGVMPLLLHAGSPVVTAKEGLAHFTELAIKAPAGDYTLSFSK